MAPSVTRRRVLRAGALAVGLPGCLASPDGPGFAETFEDGLEGWTRGADASGDWRIERSTARAATGGASARYRIDGEGTVWLVRPVSVRPGRRYRFRMWARAWSPSRRPAGVPADIVMYAAPEPPGDAGAFPARGENSSNAGVVAAGGLRQALHRAEDWLTYSFVWRAPALEAGRIHVAVGVAAVEPGPPAYFVDDVELSVRRR